MTNNTVMIDGKEWKVLRRTSVQDYIDQGAEGLADHLQQEGIADLVLRLKKGKAKFITVERHDGTYTKPSRQPQFTK